jgi:pilus assembly protein CpaB
MSRNRLLVGLLVAILAATVLSIFVYGQFAKLQSTSAAPTPTTRIVVAAQPIPLGTRVDPSMLKMIPWPVSQPLTGVCTRMADCTNRALITAVEENEPILESKLASPTAGAGLAATIPDGMRAISVAVNDVVGVAGFVTPGTMVDVLVTGAAIGSSDAHQANVTRTILENVRVLAAGQRIQQDRDGKPQTVPVITLLVSPEDAARLTMASTEGKIQLALRNAVDTDVSDPAPVLQSTLFASGGSSPAATTNRGAAKKPAAPPAPYLVEVINGNKRETKSFANADASQ